MANAICQCVEVPNVPAYETPDSSNVCANALYNSHLFKWAECQLVSQV